MTACRLPAPMTSPALPVPRAAAAALALAALLAGPWLGAQEAPATEPSPARDAVAAAAQEVVTAEEIPPEQIETFVDTVDVRVVNVDVYVTDKRGQRVTGLTQEDFRLFEDGREVPITNFYAVEGGRPATLPAAPAQTAEDGAAPAAPAPAAVDQVPSDQRLHLVIYVDNFNIRPEHRNRVLDELGYFVSTKLRRGDRAMLVTYDRSLKVRQPFTSDPQLLVRAMEEVARVTGHGVSRDDERRQAFERIAETQNPNAAHAYARTYAESMQNDLSFTVGAIKEFIDYLAGLPGRKAILYVSDGIPMVPGQEAFEALDQKFGGGRFMSDAFGYDFSRRFTELTHAANSNRVSFYTIDAAGLRLYSSFTAEKNAVDASIRVDGTINANLQSPLRYMADTTGGVAIVNTNNALPMLERIAEDFESYYSLGFSPAHAGSGRYHRLEVRLAERRRDLVVRHREGYRDKTIEAQMTDGTVSALRFAFEDNPLGVSLGFGDLQAREDRRTWIVPVDVEVPIDRIALVPRAGSHEGRLRLYISAIDDRGDASPVQQVAVPISIPDAEVERARGQTYRYTVPLLMRGGRHRVAVGLRDELGAQESFVIEDVTVGRS